jgi:hypothetical protein
MTGQNGQPDMEKQQPPDRERVAFLRSLPQEIKEQITGDEAQAFMYEEDIPESLFEKIKDFIRNE